MQIFSIALSLKWRYGGKPSTDNQALTDNYKPTVSLIISPNLAYLLPVSLPSEKESSCTFWYSTTTSLDSLQLHLAGFSSDVL